jgi:hypothetical protein
MFARAIAVTHSAYAQGRQHVELGRSTVGWTAFTTRTRISRAGGNRVGGLKCYFLHFVSSYVIDTGIHVSADAPSLSIRDGPLDHFYTTYLAHAITQTLAFFYFSSRPSFVIFVVSLNFTISVALQSNFTIYVVLTLLQVLYIVYQAQTVRVFNPIALIENL